MSEWKEYKLTELGTLQRGKSKHRPRYAFHLYDGPYPFIQTGQIREASKYITKYEQTYSEAGLAQSKLWNKGTLCITIAANIAEIAILSIDACFPDSIIGFIPNEKKCDLDFAFYTLKYFQRELQQMGDGSVQDNINLGTFEKIKFPFPPLSEQIAISNILSNLDEKIDLLHCQNKTLEQMAETLFRQWFVEEADDIRIIGKLNDMIELVYGKALKEEDRTSNGFPVIGSSGIVGYHSEYIVEAPGIVIGRKGTLGKVIYSFENFHPIDTTYYVKSKNKSVGLFYEYFLLKTLNFEEMNSDSAVPGLNRDIALSTEIKIPSQKSISEFNKYCSTLFQKIKSNNNQISTLTQLRDLLLPKLMSGEVRLKM